MIYLMQCLEKKPAPIDKVDSRVGPTLRKCRIAIPVPNTFHQNVGKANRIVISASASMHSGHSRVAYFREKLKGVYFALIDPFSETSKIDFEDVFFA